MLRLRSLVASLAVLVLGALAHAQLTYFTASLAGTNEVPPNASAGTGSATVVLDQATHLLHYDITFSGLSAAETAAHIHCCAGPGVNGPVIIGFPLGSPKRGAALVTPAQEASILAGLSYVNVHSTMFPGGEIRGQLTSVPTPQTVKHLTATLAGTNEVPPNASPGSGTASVVLDMQSLTLVYDVSFSGLVAAESAAHIHCCAAPGVNGPVIIPLPLGSPKQGSTTVTQAQAQSIAAGLSYVNVHSTTFPGGEIRGQLVVAASYPSPFNYALGDGVGTGCPCANVSPMANREGCLNSLATGGRLRANGIASTSGDSLMLNGSGMPSSSVIYLQGTARDATNGLGTSIYDGLLGVGGTIIRLGTATNVSGASTYPGLGQAAISVRGAIPPGGGVTRNYAAFYRNAAAFCTAGTANYTNSVELLWSP